MKDKTDQSRVLDNYPEGAEQSRTVPMFLRRTDLNQMVEHPDLGPKSIKKAEVKK